MDMVMYKFISEVKSSAFIVAAKQEVTPKTAKKIKISILLDNSILFLKFMWVVCYSLYNRKEEPNGNKYSVRTRA